MLRSLRIENLVLIREAQLEFEAGLNVLTGETGAGKTIFAQAIGLLLGARGDAAMIGAAASEAYVEAEFDLPSAELLGALAEMLPDGEGSLTVARRVFGDGRTRAYAWGRAAAREDVAAVVESLVAMSGQFQQRRLARASYQVAVLDAFAGNSRLLGALHAAWRELASARRIHEQLRAQGAEGEARLAELRALVADVGSLEPGRDEQLAEERARLRHVDELAAGAQGALDMIVVDDGDGAADLVAGAHRRLEPLRPFAPELNEPTDLLAAAQLSLREVASTLRRFLDALDAQPGRLEEVERQLEEIADLRRRYRASSYAELLEAAQAASEELDALQHGVDPLAAAAARHHEAQAAFDELLGALRSARAEAAPRFAEAVGAQLAALGLEPGGFRVELGDGDPGPNGGDEVTLTVRLNRGLGFRPLAETASGGELSRIALAIAAVAGGETMVFDEIDAGVGGTTAHAVGSALEQLATRAQVIAITHLPQIASLAERHFRVAKVPGDPTHTTIESLDGDTRRVELERMLGGAEFLARLGSPQD